MLLNTHEHLYSRLVNIVPDTVKGKFLYSAVSSAQERSKSFTLYFPDMPIHSDTNAASLVSIQSYATINARRLLVHISTIAYCQVLIYILSELEQCRVKKPAQDVNTATRDSNPGARSRESEALPMSHCAARS